MDALFIYVSNKLEEIKYGPQDGKSKLINLKEMKSFAFWRAVIAEFLATMLFVFLGVASTLGGSGEAKEVKIGLTFGLAIMAMIQVTGHVSGAHINPAVTIAMTVAMKISIMKAILYIVAQCAGGVIGAYILRGCVDTVFHSNLGVTNISSVVTPAQGFGIELLLTFILVSVIFGTTDGNRPAFGSPALLIGLTVALGHFSCIKLTGSSMNPARSLGSAVASDSFENHWIYWVGPIVGGVLAAVVYVLILNPYRGVKSTEEALQDMIQDENFIVIPRDYFKDGKMKQAQNISSHL
ncbi:aquaporin AQPAe.a-like [Patella vulgata]|uniref:aquaporin AQPAe.a-like n=1 Tax=Patella vulgata TaxID=6465 RepID=UPI0024A909D1|nr:aquaporin AQPAe.a-like [Patella vulgata]